MKIALLVLLLPIAACTHPSAAGGDAPGSGEGPLLSTASLSAGTKAQLCPPDVPTSGPPRLPDLAPEPDGGVIIYPPTQCWLIDAARGGEQACCGGDLTTQSCGPGLDCYHPQGSDIGVCIPQGPPGDISSVCIDRHQPPGCSFYAANDILINGDDPNRLGCELEAHCGPNGELLYRCDSGTCSCFQDDGTASTFPEGNLCTGSVKDALAAAQANCAFPSSFPGGRYTDPWQ